MEETKKRKPINSDLIILACVAVVVLFFCVCSTFTATMFSGGWGKCISFSLFGKLELLGVDRAVISVYGSEIAITDTKLLDQIVSETKSATYCDSACEEDCCGCFEPHWQFDLYRGDRLVRSMVLEECCDAVKVYEPDLTHWLIPPLDGTVDAGYIELSDELAAELYEIMGRNRP